MTKWLIRYCIKDYANTSCHEVRASYGKLAGVLGILVNLFLFIIKFLAGIVGNSVAILSDAFNNLSDMASSAVSYISVTLSGRSADEEHPFGHGRIEYIASLIVSFLIMLVGFELLKTSLDKTVHPQPISFNYLSLGILLVSIVVKLWLFFAGRYIGKTIGSVVVQATARDSLNDVFATGGVVVSMFLGLVLSAPVDGIMGLVISLLIMYAGFSIAKDTVTILLGTAPDPAMAEQICNMILEQEGISGVHDLIIHDYGPGRCMASIHAEVPEDGNFVKIHELIDETEKKISRELGVHMVIHMDPIAVGNSRIEECRNQVLACVQAENPAFHIHDFRMTDGERVVNLIFDLEVPFSLKEEEREQAAENISCRLKEVDPRYCTVIHVENVSWRSTKEKC